MSGSAKRTEQQRCPVVGSIAGLRHARRSLALQPEEYIGSNRNPNEDERPHSAGNEVVVMKEAAPGVTGHVAAE